MKLLTKKNILKLTLALVGIVVICLALIAQSKPESKIVIVGVSTNLQPMLIVGEDNSASGTNVGAVEDIMEIYGASEVHFVEYPLMEDLKLDLVNKKIDFALVGSYYKIFEDSFNVSLNWDKLNSIKAWGEESSLHLKDIARVGITKEYLDNGILPNSIYSLHHIVVYDDSKSMVMAYDLGDVDMIVLDSKSIRYYRKNYHLSRSLVEIHDVYDIPLEQKFLIADYDGAVSKINKAILQYLK